MEPRTIYAIMGEYGSYEQAFERVVRAYTKREDAEKFKADLEAAIKAGPWEWVQGHGIHCAAVEELDPLATPEGHEPSGYRIDEVKLFDV